MTVENGGAWGGVIPLDLKKQMGNSKDPPLSNGGYSFFIDVHVLITWKIWRYEVAHIANCFFYSP
jgi:hypothetical protein